MTAIAESLDILAGVLLSPSATFTAITRRKPLALALAAAVSVAVISGLVLVPNPPELAEDIMQLPKGSFSLWAVLPLWVVFFLAVLFLQAAFVHLAATRLGAPGHIPGSEEGSPGHDDPPDCDDGRARGRFRGLLCALSFAYLPGLFTAPLMLLRALLASTRANAVYQAAFPLLALWVFFLGVTAVRQNYQMSLRRATAVCGLALAVLVVLPAVLAMVVMTQVMA